MDLKTTMSGWRIWSKSWWAWSIKVEDGWKAQQLMSLVRTVMSFWRWVLMVRAWICLSSLREVQWGKRDRGGEVIVLGFVGEEENGLIWRALAAAIWVGCVVFV